MAELFLVRYPESPCQVPSRGKVSIGRSEENGIILTELRVSRFHAQIAWQAEQDKFMLSDCGSSNGTYLNGVRITPKEPVDVSDWDKIRIASSVFTARFVDNPWIINNEFNALRDRVHNVLTEVLNIKELMNIADNEPVLSGELSQLCPIDLFQMLENGRKTGSLTVVTENGEGLYHISDGNIVSGFFNSHRGEEAVFEVIKSMEGQFAFTLKTSIDVAPEITIPTTALLMEGCRLLDEANAGMHKDIEKTIC